MAASASPASSPFLSTLPARGATPCQMAGAGHQWDFYPRSPRGERPLSSSSQINAPNKFLSTLPARGATWGPRSSMELQIDFYPRSPRGERQYCPACRPVVEAISIHAPREGSDTRAWSWGWDSRPISIHAPREGSDRVFTTSFAAPDRFLSTLPARGATQRAVAVRPAGIYFYPRSPRGERLMWTITSS